MPDQIHQNEDLPKLDSGQAILNTEDISSEVLKRLVAEVRTEKTQQPTTVYDRVHNRHNRGR